MVPPPVLRSEATVSVPSDVPRANPRSTETLQSGRWMSSVSADGAGPAPGDLGSGTAGRVPTNPCAEHDLVTGTCPTRTAGGPTPAPTSTSTSAAGRSSEVRAPGAGPRRTSTGITRTTTGPSTSSGSAPAATVSAIGSTRRSLRSNWNSADGSSHPRRSLVAWLIGRPRRPSISTHPSTRSGPRSAPRSTGSARSASSRSPGTARWSPSPRGLGSSIRRAWRTLGGTRSTRGTDSPGAADPLVLAAQDVIAWGANRAGCHNFTGTSTCRDAGSGRSRHGRYGADRWCSGCILMDALEQRGAR